MLTVLIMPCCIILQSGQLNEYTERKDMTAEVTCMSLGTVPAGEQRSRFLAVGLADQTVRIISLDPSVSTLYFSIVFCPLLDCYIKFVQSVSHFSCLNY